MLAEHVVDVVFHSLDNLGVVLSYSLAGLPRATVDEGRLGFICVLLLGEEEPELLVFPAVVPVNRPHVHVGVPLGFGLVLVTAVLVDLRSNDYTRLNMNHVL